MLSEKGSPRYRSGEAGAAPLLVLLIAVGVLSLFALTNTATFKDDLFSKLFPKSPSQAADCTVQKPTVVLIPWTQWGTAPGELTYQLQVTNNNTGTCPPSDYRVEFLETYRDNLMDIIPNPLVFGVDQGQTKSAPILVRVNNATHFDGSEIGILSFGINKIKDITFLVGWDYQGTGSYAVNWPSPTPKPIVNCTLNNPSVSITPTNQQANPGDTKQYSVKVTNNDSGTTCTTASFSINSMLPSGLTQSPATSLLSVAPGQSASMLFSVTSNPALADGTYQVKETAIRGSNVGSATATYTINVKPVVSITFPTAGSVIGKGTTTTIQADVVDTSLVKIEFYIYTGRNKGKPVYTVATETSPVYYPWKESSKGSNTVTYNIMARAYDSVGNYGDSPVVTVTAKP